MDVFLRTANPNIRLGYYLIAVLLAVLVSVIAYFYHRKKLLSGWQALALVILVTYTFLVFASTVFSRTQKPYYRYEWMPFWSYREIIVNGSVSLFWDDVLNLFLLMPVGFLLPVLLENAEWGSGGKIIFTGFLMSLTIEVLQLIFRLGLYEFDDLFHNTMGVAIGYGLYLGLQRGLRMEKERNKRYERESVKD